MHGSIVTTSSAVVSAPQYYRWIVLALACVILFGNFYAYDLPASISTPLQQHFNYDDATWSYLLQSLYSVYSIPNLFLPIVAGHLTDRWGTRTALIVCGSFVCVGQAIVSLGIQFGSFSFAALGRLVFGIGGESLSVAQTRITTKWFRGKEVGLAMGVNLSVARLGSVANDVVSPWIAVSSHSVTAAMWVGLMTCLLSFGSALLLVGLDRHRDVSERKRKGSRTEISSNEIDMRLLGSVDAIGDPSGRKDSKEISKKRDDGSREFLPAGRRHRHENGYRQLFNEETVDRGEGGGDDQEEGKISMGGEQRELLTGEAQSHVRSSTGVITTSSTNSESGTLRVPAVPGKHFPQADSGIDPEKRDILSNPLPPREIESVSEANGKNFEPSQDAVEENKENQQPETFFCGVDPNNDKGFPADSPFGSDLAHLLTPYAQESILENDLFSKLREPISVSEAMAISGESEPGTTPIIREGALGELSAEHLYITEPKARELVYIPSEGLPCRYDSSENFVPTLTIESALKDIRTALSNFDAFEIWEDSDGISGEGQKDKAIAYKVQEIEEEDVNNGDSEDESELNDDEYEALLQLHFGNGFSENNAENPSQGTIVVRSQASARVSITYNNITESRRLVEDNIGSCSPPSKFRILHRSPVTDRDDFDGVETGDNAEAVAHRGTVAEHASDENTPPRTDVDPFIAVHSDKTETPPDSTSSSIKQ